MEKISNFPESSQTRHICQFCNTELSRLSSLFAHTQKKHPTVWNLYQIMKKEDRKINLYQALDTIAKDKSLKIDTKAIPNLRRGRKSKC